MCRCAINHVLSPHRRRLLQAALQASSKFEAQFPAKASEIEATKAAILEARDARRMQAERRRTRRQTLGRRARAGWSGPRAPGQQAPQTPAERLASGEHASASGAAEGVLTITSAIRALLWCLGNHVLHRSAVPVKIICAAFAGT